MTARRWMRRVATLSALASTACVGVGPLDPDGLEVQITPENVVLTAIGAQHQLEFTIGDGVTPPDIVWQSSAPTIVAVDSNGTLTALNEGSSRISASSQGMEATTTVTVAARITNVIQVQSEQTDPNSANNTSTVIVTVTAD